MSITQEAFQQAVEITGLVLTLTSVLLVLFTLLEMRAERKSSYRPDIFVKKQKVFGYWDNLGSLRLFMREKKLSAAMSGDEKSVLKKFEELETIFITLVNVGAGAATDIEVEWNYDFEEAIRVINDFCLKRSILIFVENVQLRNTCRMICGISLRSRPRVNRAA